MKLRINDECSSEHDFFFFFEIPEIPDRNTGFYRIPGFSKIFGDLPGFWYRGIPVPGLKKSDFLPGPGISFPVRYGSGIPDADNPCFFTWKFKSFKRQRISQREASQAQTFLEHIYAQAHKIQKKKKSQPRERFFIICLKIKKTRSAPEQIV